MALPFFIILTLNIYVSNVVYLDPKIVLSFPEEFRVALKTVTTVSPLGRITDSSPFGLFHPISLLSRFFMDFFF